MIPTPNVHDFVIVGMLQRAGDGDCQVDRFRHFRPAGREQVAQVHPVDEIAGDEDAAVLLAHFVHRDDIGMP